MSIAASHRPDPDELAAFVDGQLSGEERRLLEVHLGACEACREVVAESLLLLKDLADEPPVDTKIEALDADAESELGKVLTHPGWHRAAWRLAPLAAAASLLGILLGPALTSWLSPSPDALIAGLVDPPGGNERLADGWTEQEWPVFRTDSYVRTLSEEQIAFRLGVRAVDLQVALRAGTDRDRLEILSELIVLLRDGVSFAFPLQLQYEQIRESLDESSLQQAMEAASDVEEDLREFLDSDDYSLGQWVEVGRLATILGERAYFERSWFRRQARKLERTELKPEVIEQIRQIRETSEVPLDDQVLETLRDAFGEIVRNAG